MVKNIFSSLLGKQSGHSVLAIVLVLVVLGSLILGPLLGFMGTGLKEGQMHEAKAQRLYAADSGIEDAISWLIHGMPTGGNWHWTWDGNTAEKDSYEINDVTVDVTVESLPEANTYKIMSTATSPDGDTTILAALWAIAWFDDDQEFNNQNPPPPGVVHVDGDVELSNNVEFTGNLTATGNATSMNNVRIIGNMGITGNVIFENNAELTGTLCCGGDITLGNGCKISGEVRLQGDDATITLTEAGAHVEANIRADGNLSIDIDTNASIIGDICAPDGNIEIYLGKNNAEIVGDIYASGTINIWGQGTHDGTEYSNNSTCPFPEPECPVIPEKGSDILNYEVT